MTPLADHPLVRQVAAFCRRQGLLAGAGAVLAGFSGGADSTALLLILHALAPERLRAVHFHHGLRGAAADADAAWCRDFCGVRSIPLRLEALAVPRQRRRGESLEAAARRLRLAAWRRLALAESAAAVALGHHADDRLETLLLRLARGANASGLAAPRPVAVLDGVRLVRPLLECRRAELASFLREQGIAEWREDESNRDLRLLRNAVRHRWLPLIRADLGHDRGLLATLRALDADAAFLEAAALRAAESATPGLAALRPLPAALRPRVLRQWLTAAAGADWIAPESLLRRVEAALAKPGPCRIPVAGGRLLVLEEAGLRLAPAPLPAAAAVAVAESATIAWDWRACSELALPGGATLVAAEGPAPADPVAASGRDTAWFAAAALPPVLQVRFWRPGDRLRPFGAQFTKKIQDILVDAKIPRERRGRIPLLLAGTAPAWLAGVCRAEFARLRGVAGEPAVCIRLLWPGAAAP
ncbi:MAG: tRNA lysidine(34) synthetase TilS [Lentisphaeria bacterium]|jgi:tRNA(Ile)-lysidine synthase